MDAVPVMPDPPPGESPAALLLDRIAAAGYQQVPVVNSVAEPLPLPPPYSGDDRARRKALRRAARAERRRRRHPEKFRVEFSAWVAVPWRDRPVEARLADFAVATAEAVVRSAAWRHPLLEEHRVRLDPSREAADIAIGAYRIYCARRDLGAPPRQRFGDLPESDGALGDAVRASYQEKKAALDAAWQALVRRLAAFDAYRQHLAEIGPVLVAADTAAYLDGVPFGERVAQIVTAGASDDFAASDTGRLAHEAEALAQILTQAQQQGEAGDPAGRIAAASAVPVTPGMLTAPPAADASLRTGPPGAAPPPAEPSSEE